MEKIDVIDKTLYVYYNIVQ